MQHKWFILVAVLLAGGGSIIHVPSVAQAQGVAWSGQYYNNGYLIEPAAVTRQDGAVAFDWGLGSPAAGVNADGFSVRWAADPYFEAGTYRFWALADDSIRVNVGFAFQAQIDTFAQAKPGQIISADVTLSAGVHHVQVDYREDSGAAYAYVTWANLASNPTGPNWPGPQISYATVNTGSWTAEYYGNNNLVGSPTAILSEVNPSHTWGSGSPVASVPADNFSARWTSSQSLEAGNYRLTVRADDGVRVYMDGIIRINEWHGASGQTYTVDLTIAAGTHNFTIEYYEAAGDAFLDYTLARITTAITSGSQTTSASGATATVTAARLNVRKSPSASAEILTRINLNERYSVLGKNASGTWWQINANGITGWVFGRFVTLAGNLSAVPVIDSAAAQLAQPVDTGYDVTALTTVNIRSAPSLAGAILTKMNRNDTARVVGRTTRNDWWQVTYQGITGWVSSTYAQIQPGVLMARIPVTG
jgi:uncharacterized protein YgiM (DUF1202 family)